MKRSMVSDEELRVDWPMSRSNLICFFFKCAQLLSQEVSKRLVSGLIIPPIYPIIRRLYSPVTNHLLTSGDIQLRSLFQELQQVPGPFFDFRWGKLLTCSNRWNPCVATRAFHLEQLVLDFSHASIDSSHSDDSNWCKVDLKSPVISVGAHNSIYRGEITPVKPMYFRPFIGATRYTPYAHFVHIS